MLVDFACEVKPLNEGQPQDNKSVLYSEVSFFRGNNIIISMGQNQLSSIERCLVMTRMY